MEAMFNYSPVSAQGRDTNRLAEMIIRGKKKLKVCSLSKKMDCPLLWAHYASGFSGLVLEVGLPDSSPEVKSVVYRKDFPTISADVSVDPEMAVEDILGSKLKVWRYECEVRVIHEDDHYSLSGPVRQVIVGHRMSPHMVKALHMVCRTEAVPMAQTVINGCRIETKPIQMNGMNIR